MAAFLGQMTEVRGQRAELTEKLHIRCLSELFGNPTKPAIFSNKLFFVGYCMPLFFLRSAFNPLLCVPCLLSPIVCYLPFVF